MLQDSLYRPISHIRIYPSKAAGFDGMVRCRGGLVKHSTEATLEGASRVAHALHGKDSYQPIFVCEHDFETMLKAHGWEGLVLIPARDLATVIGE